MASRRNIGLIRGAIVAAVVLAAAACGGGGGSSSPTPHQTPSTPIPAGAPAIGVLSSIGFYGRDPGDNATSVVLGDFNGDHYTDLAMGAGLADGPDQPRTDAGEVDVFLGPLEPNTIRDAGAGQQGLTVYGAQPGDQVGRALAAGDVNGDGIDDLVMGVPFGDGPAEDRADAGEVSVILGAPDFVGSGTRDLAAGADYTVYGVDPDDLAGLSVAVADVSGDGIADVIVGALWGDGPDGSRSNAGEVHVVLGSSALSGRRDLAVEPADTSVYGAATEYRLGETLTTGDVNGDGLADLVLVAPFAPSVAGHKGAGQTYVILSPPPARVDTATDTVTAVIYGTDEGDQLGHSAAVGDVDGDGLGDVLLGAVSADGAENSSDLAGEVALIAGSALSGTVDTAAGGAASTIYGIDPLDRLGRSVALGDIDGDGRSDVLMGAPGGANLGNAEADAGEVYLLHAVQILDETIQLPSTAAAYYGGAGDQTASSVTGRPALLAQDVDSDGLAELIFAAPGSDGPDGTRTDCGGVFILFLAQ